MSDDVKVVAANANPEPAPDAPEWIAPMVEQLQEMGAPSSSEHLEKELCVFARDVAKKVFWQTVAEVSAAVEVAEAKGFKLNAPFVIQCMLDYQAREICYDAAYYLLRDLARAYPKDVFDEICACLPSVCGVWDVIMVPDKDHPGGRKVGIWEYENGEADAPGKVAPLRPVDGER